MEWFNFLIPQTPPTIELEVNEGVRLTGWRSAPLGGEWGWLVKVEHDLRAEMHHSMFSKNNTLFSQDGC